MTLGLCLSFQFFFSIGESFEIHPLAPFLLMEAVLGTMIVWATLVVLARLAQGRLRSLDVLFYVTPFLFSGLSALLANHNFGQPLILGIGEDRRVFSFLFWFLLEPIFRRGRLSLDDLLNCMIACGAIYLACGLFVQAAFAQQLMAREIPHFDPRKLRISSPGECFYLCIVIGMCRALSGYRGQGAWGLLVGLLGLALVAQTRQVILALVLVAAVTFIWARPLPTIFLGTGALLLTTALALLDLDAGLGLLVQAALPNLHEFGADHLEYNTRSLTGRIVMEAVWRNGLVGLGALSKQFDTGLQVFHGRDFYINDVGIMGEIYRLGAVALMLFALWAAVELALWKRVTREEDRVLTGALLLAMLALFTLGWIFRYGYLHTFIVLVLLAAAEPRPLAPAGARVRRGAAP